MKGWRSQVGASEIAPNRLEWSLCGASWAAWCCIGCGEGCFGISATPSTELFPKGPRFFQSISPPWSLYGLTPSAYRFLTYHSRNTCHLGALHLVAAPVRWHWPKNFCVTSSNLACSSRRISAPPSKWDYYVARYAFENLLTNVPSVECLKPATDLGFRASARRPSVLASKFLNRHLPPRTSAHRAGAQDIPLVWTY